MSIVSLTPRNARSIRCVLPLVLLVVVTAVLPLDGATVVSRVTRPIATATRQPVRGDDDRAGVRASVRDGVRERARTPAAPTRVVARRVIGATGARHVVRDTERWSASAIHELRAPVIVAAGGTLVLEPGTRVEGRPGSYLSVERDGRLVADGTLTEPIELTCTSVPRYEGCWGGVTLAGNATINHGLPTSPAARGVGGAGCLEASIGQRSFGGCDDADSSGVLRFARIEYARDGLQLLGVGAHTLVDYVQVNRSRGTGLTVHGGTVDVRRLFLTANQGFGMAWFGGWTGRGQFLTIQQDAQGQRGGLRGSNAPAEGSPAQLGSPRSNPTLYNVTVVAPSTLSNPHHGSSPAAIVLAEGTSGSLRNVLLYAPHVGFDLRDELTCVTNDGPPPTLRNVLVAGAGSVGSPDADAACGGYASPDAEAQWLADPANQSAIVSDPTLVAALQPAIDLSLPDLRPLTGSAAASMPLASPPNDGFFLASAPFAGSVAVATSARNNIPWYSGWTVAAPYPPVPGQVTGTVGAAPRGPFGGVDVSSASGVSTTTASNGDYTLTLAAGTHTLAVSQLPGECASPAITVNVPSGGSATASLPVSCTAVTEVAPAPLHACAATQDGRTLCWGSNDQGTLGTGSVSAPSALPVAVVAPFPLTSLTSGYSHTCAVGPGGVAYCWGLNAFAALGIGTLGGASATPTTPASGGVSFVAIAAGGYHTCALTNAGEAWCWGWNLEGQTGIGAVGSPVILPQRVADGGLRFVQLAAGDSHTCALTATGAAYCWGGNGRGELGDDPATIGAVRSTPFPVPGGHVFVSIDAGRTHTCGVTTSGQALCWGERDAGQTGDGTVGGATIQPAPVSGNATFASISAGSQTTCGITTTGTALCWGRGDGGLLGDGSVTPAVATPVAVSGGHTFAQVSVSLASGPGGVACARNTLGQVWCWGAGGLGQRGDGTFTPAAGTPVAVRLPPPF